MDTTAPDSPMGGGLPMTLAMGVASAAVLAVSVGVLMYRGSSSGSSMFSKSFTGTSLPSVRAKSSRLAPLRTLSLESPDKPRVRILYGTQTGTAERFSKQIAGELRKKYGEELAVEVIDLENYKAAGRMPREKIVVLCLATYGDGEPTDNAAEFFSWLAKEVETGEKPLQNVCYGVFGLGNKQYEHFNAMGKKAHTSMAALGATPLVERGDGDDDGCIDEDFDKWTAELFAALDARPDLVGKAQEGATSSGPAEELPAYTVEVFPANQQEDLAFPPDGTGRDHHSPFWATITAARELHAPSSDRSCVHVEIDITGAGASYEAGDHVAIHAANSDAVVEEVAGLLGFNLNEVVRLGVPRTAKDQGILPPPQGRLSVRALLAWHSDLLAAPRKDALAALAAHASNPAHAARLAHLASHEGKQEYADWVARPHRSLLEVLREFPSTRPPLGLFLAQVAPRLQPRFYSISSSPKQHPDAVHVTCAVVREQTLTARTHEGVASTWLARNVAASLGGKVPVFLRSSHFKLPKDPSAPVVMVGPGTGLAPFRGFLQERAALRASAELGPAVLFFGCRTQAADYIYESELAAHVAGGELSTLHVAFSRDGASKVYVQHHMEREAAALWSLLGERGGYLYVCGDAKAMAKDVHRALVALVMAKKGCTGTQAEAWVKALQDSGRYQRDVW